MLNPSHMTRLADLLRQGAIMKRVIQPYESHMQYILQWMCDYNLYGCAYIDCSEVRFRSPIPEFLEMNNATHKWHDRTIPPCHVLNEEMFPRQSHCSIEVDVFVADILNRRDVNPRLIHHDFIERNTPDSVDEKLVQSMAGLWRDETRRRKARLGIIDPGSSPFPPEVLVSVSADPRNTQAGGWIHENEYREKLNTIVQNEKAKSDGKRIGFNDFVGQIPYEKHIKTALESIEDLFPENLMPPAIIQRPSQIRLTDGSTYLQEIPQVDESRLLSYRDDDFPYESDEELAREMEMSQRGQAIMVDERTRRLAPGPFHEGGADVNGAKSEADTTGHAEAPPMNIILEKANHKYSSGELRALGIREVGDSNHDEDDFDIPEDFTGQLGVGRTETTAIDPDPLRKKQKMAHEAHNNFNTLNGESQMRARQSNDYAGPRPAMKPTRLGKSVGSSPKQSSALKQKDESNRKVLCQASRSQELANGRNTNGKLSFSVVKNPHDPSTILKLSQRNSSPQKSSRKAMFRSGSVADSSEPRSTLLSLSKSTLKGSPTPAKTSPQTVRCCEQVCTSFGIRDRTLTCCIPVGPPNTTDLQPDIKELNIVSAIYQDAYYSSEKDVPERAREYAGKGFRLESDTVPYLPAFDPSGTSLASAGSRSAVAVDRHAEEIAYHQSRHACSLRTWEFEDFPPTRLEVQNWVDDDLSSSQSSSLPNCLAMPPSGKPDLSQIDAVTQKNKHGFKYSQKQESTSVQHETQYMSIMSLEIHVNTRNNLVPNPEEDEICCVFWCLKSDDEELEVNGVNEGTHVGIIVLSEKGGLALSFARQTPAEVEEESSELDLINRMVDIVRQYDPDILTGYEVHGGSWGYMIERARLKYDYNLCDEFSRMKSQSHGRFGRDDDRWGFNQTSTIRVTGRHMINIWRAMRGELNLLQYTMENVVFQLCHRRTPHYPFPDLTTWYTSGKPRDLAKVLEYYLSRVQLDLEILEQNELVPRTSEQARLLGVDFFSVFSRGSQFKVESLMFRIAKPENFLLPSPSRKQVGQQNALECLPLVMEPQSAFYNSPLLVLDFQSLYPSVMIAYNYCYSTYMGRVVNWRGQNKMGFTDYHREPRLLELLSDQVNIAPNGIMYAKPRIRKSLLAKMLGEILETRVMVKSGMKIDKDDKTLQRLLNNRQLALKLIANVTYGYTSASFSGRMPCSEIADSIVQTGREILEKAIALIHSVERWGAEVVYGDTDSLFVYLKGRTKDEAFDMGQEIAKTVTEMNPRPVKLKFEKVYFPCILLAKKRYVGYKYESKIQTQPDFDAKGIETVRRDGTPAEQKIEEKALRILFQTSDLSQVKRYFQSQCAKIMRGKVSIQDFCFAKEVKLGTYSDKGLPPPGALISTRRMLEDPRAEPQYGERVPYVVIAGAPGARLIDRCVAPDILLHDDNNELDSEYYISKNLIPPLERIFNLVGANVRQWYDEMPKVQRIRHIDASSLATSTDQINAKKTLESYMKSSSCLVCREKLEEEIGICGRCARTANTSLCTVQTRLSRAEMKASRLEETCRSCASMAWGEDIKCDSKDCPVYYTRTRHITQLKNISSLTTSIMGALQKLETNGLDW